MIYSSTSTWTLRGTPIKKNSNYYKLSDVASYIMTINKKKKKKKKKKKEGAGEGAPGIEPGTSRSAVECSTTELHPQAYINRIRIQNRSDLIP